MIVVRLRLMADWPLQLVGHVTLGLAEEDQICVYSRHCMSCNVDCKFDGAPWPLRNLQPAHIGIGIGSVGRR